MLFFLGFGMLLYSQTEEKKAAAAEKDAKAAQKVIKALGKGLGKLWPFKRKTKEAPVVTYDTLLKRYVFGMPGIYMQGYAPGVHQRQEEKYLRQLNNIPNRYFTEKEWAVQENIVPDEHPYISHRKPGTRVVYGFHPFWKGNAYYGYDFGILSRVGYFSYSVNAASGKSRSPFMAHSWVNSTLQQKAHAAGCKVDLVVTSYGEKNNSQLLGPGGAAARQTLADSLGYLINMKYIAGKDTGYRGDGVTLDFEGFRDDPSAGKELTSFVSGLRKKLETSRDGAPVSINMVLPVCAPYRSYEFDSLKKYVDLFIICGYDYYLDTIQAGPSSVLEADTGQFYFSVDYSVNYYLDKGLPVEKTVLSLPWYAKVATTDTSTAFALSHQASELTFESHSKAWLMYGSVRTPLRDPANNAVYYPVRDDNGWKQIWTEDTVTLGLKYDYVLKKGLAGAGVWSLGDASDSPELWQLLRNKFGDTSYVPTVATTNVDTVISKNTASIQKQKQAVIAPLLPEITGVVPNVIYPSVLPVRLPEKNYGLVAIFCLITLLCFALIGFLIAMFYESVREVVLSRDYFLYIVSAVVVVTILLLLRGFGYMENNTVVFIAGALGGAGLVTVLFRRLRKKTNDEVTP